MSQISVKDASNATVSVELPLPPGRAAATASRPVTLSNEDNATIGALTETAPATDTASSGLNGRLQRVAQRLTSIIGLLPATLGQKTMANSLAVAIASDQGSLPLSTGASTSANQTTALGYLSTIATNAASTTPSPVVGPGKWETVAASASAQVLGATGAAGDFLSHVLIVPATTSPGAVSITDGAGSAITIFAGGASSVSNLVSFAVPLGMTSTSGAWKVTTGSSVSAIGIGSFT